MGLAPYGEPTHKDLIMSELIDVKEDGAVKFAIASSAVECQWLASVRNLRQLANTRLDRVAADDDGGAEAEDEGDEIEEPDAGRRDEHAAPRRARVGHGARSRGRGLPFTSALITSAHRRRRLSWRSTSGSRRRAWSSG